MYVPCMPRVCPVFLLAFFGIDDVDDFDVDAADDDDADVDDGNPKARTGRRRSAEMHAMEEQLKDLQVKSRGSSSLVPKEKGKSTKCL